MFVLLLLAAQASAPASAPGDISIRATLDARSVKVEQKGTASIAAHAEPDGGSTAVSSGTRGSRHFEVQIDARIADPLAAAPDGDAEATDPAAPR